jgi:ribonuclease Z
MRLIIYSKGLYSTWLYYAPDRLAFDAGEGISSILGNKCFAIQHVFLSHGHADHISGLIGLINIRNSGMGDTEKPLTIYYPKENWRVLELIAYIAKTNSKLSYDLAWVPLEPGDRVTLFEGQNPRYIEAFRTQHTRSELSLGYNIVEVRRRLKEEYRGLPQEEIAQLVREKGREAITTTYPQKLFSYGGDSAPIDPRLIEGTEVLCHEATFLNPEDRENPTHSTLEEALEVARRAGVKRELFVIHISSRYRRELPRVEEELRKLDLGFRVVLVPPGRVCRYD